MPKNPKKPESKTKTIIKEMLASVDCTLVKAVEERNLMFPESATSAQNLSNKLQRETITFREVIELAEALGLKIRWVPLDDEPETILSRIPSENEELNYKEIATEGFATVESSTFGYFLLLGANSKAAADWMKKHLQNAKTKEQELVIASQAIDTFQVELRIV